MKTLGYLLLVLGALYLIFVFNMDVSVTSPSVYIPGMGSVGGGEVANLDLMAQRQNHLIVASLITLIGALMAIFGQGQGLNYSETAKIVSPNFSGDRDIHSDAYRLWLSKYYQIERNDVFDRFVLGEQTFDTLEVALAYGHKLEENRLLAELSDQEFANTQKEAGIEFARVAAENAEAEWQERKPKLLVALTIAAVVAASYFFITRESTEQRTSRVAREETKKAELFQSIEKTFGVKLPANAENVKVYKDAANYKNFCDDDNDGTLLEFKTETIKKEIKDLFASSLGQGKAQYDFMDDYDWTWQKNKVRYELTMLNDDAPFAVYFCIMD